MLISNQLESENATEILKYIQNQFEGLEGLALIEPPAEKRAPIKKPPAPMPQSKPAPISRRPAPNTQSQGLVGGKIVI